MTVTSAFNGTTSLIASNTGTDFTTGAFTLAAMVYNTSATSQRTIVSFATGGGATPKPRLIFDSTTSVAMEFSDGNFPPWGSSISSGSWFLIVVTKAAGSVAPKLYVTSDGSTWTKDGAAPDAGNGIDETTAIDLIQIGAHNSGSLWNGEIACIAYANTEASSGTVHGLTNFNNWGSLTNLRFFTGDSLINAGTMNDTGSGNNDETSRTAISTGSQAVPSWFTNFGANLGTLGRATRLVEYVKAVGTVTNTTGATTSAITVATGGVPVGNSVVIVSSADNSGTNGAIQASTVSDTRGNQWNYCTHAIADPGAANAGQEGFVAWANITVALQASDTITITWPTSTAAKAVRADEFKYMGGLVTQATQDNQTAQSVSVAVTATGVGQLVIGGVAVEGGTADAFTQDTDTTNGSWVNPGRLGSGTTTSGATLNPIYKIVTAPGVQTYDHATMLGTSRDHCAMLAVFACLPYDSRPDAFGRHRGRAMVRRR